MKRILFLIFFLPIAVMAQNSLSITVHGVKNSEGKISVAVYNSSDDFLNFDKVFKCDSTMAIQGNTHLRIDNLPAGEYALAVFHDENSNDELDTNWLGIPKEAVGFSNAKMKTFGPPKFKECVISLKKDNKVTVILQ